MSSDHEKNGINFGLDQMGTKGSRKVPDPNNIYIILTIAPNHGQLLPVIIFMKVPRLKFFYF